VKSNFVRKPTLAHAWQLKVPMAVVAEAGDWVVFDGETWVSMRDEDFRKHYEPYLSDERLSRV
jgi:hypothetical protein